MLNVLICRAAEERQREVESKEELARKVAQDEAHRKGVHQQRLQLEADRAMLRYTPLAKSALGGRLRRSISYKTSETGWTKIGTSLTRLSAEV